MDAFSSKPQSDVVVLDVVINNKESFTIKLSNLTWHIHAFLHVPHFLHEVLRNFTTKRTSFEKNCFSAWASTLNMGLINKVDMVCLSPVGYGV